MPQSDANHAAPPLAEVNARLPILSRIPETHPVRLLALAVGCGEPIDTIQPFIDSLLDPSPDRWHIRVISAWALSRTSLPAAQLDAATASLLDVLENARPERWRDRMLRSLKRHVGIALGGGLLGTIAFMLLQMGWGHSFYEPVFGIFLMFSSIVLSITLPITLPASFWFDKMRDNRVRAAAASALGSLAEPESVGALAGALAHRSRHVRESAAASLHNVLPTLKPEHYGAFGSESIANLGRVLSHPDAQLVSKALAALSVIGTSHAIPFVRRAAQAGRTVRLRDSAAEVLALLEERQRHETNHGTLLRPTSSPNDPSSILMRPAGPSMQPNAEVLLRTVSDRDN